MLVLSLLAWAVGATAVYQLSLLIPRLQSEIHISVATAGTLVGIANGGLALGLFAWGVAADRFGERKVMACGLVLCALSGAGAAASGNVVLLAVAFAVTGLAAGSVYAPSSRLVLKWFPPRQHGLAMSVTQISTPLASAIAAATLPAVAAADGFRPVLLVMAGACLVVGVLVAVFVRAAPTAGGGGRDTGRNAPRPTTGLGRMYAVSMLLFLPQISLLTFTVSYLVHRGWDPASAGQALGLALLATCVTRPIMGYWSDRIGRRLGLMRWLAVLNVCVLVALTIGTATNSQLSAVAVLLAVTSMVTGSGLIATAVAQFADAKRTGRSLGVQNTLQNGMGVLAPIALGNLIDFGGYTVTFAIIAVAPLIGVFMIPVAAERAAVAAARSRPDRATLSSP